MAHRSSPGVSSGRDLPFISQSVDTLALKEEQAMLVVVDLLLTNQLISEAVRQRKHQHKIGIPCVRAYVSSRTLVSGTAFQS
jgi:hypothetical protein